MNARTGMWLAAGIAAGIGLLLLTQRPAESQAQVAPTFSAVGVAASGNTSTAWFHHQASGRVVACQVAGGAIQCMQGRLP